MCRRPHRGRAGRTGAGSGEKAGGMSGRAGRHWRITALTLTVVLALSCAAYAQRRRFFGWGGGHDPDVENAPYDGRFTFARLKYTTAPGGYWYQGLPAWAHGYPISEDNLMRIMNEVTDLGARTDAFNVYSLDDPELAHYPV